MAIAVLTSFMQLTDNSGNLLAGGTVTVYDATTTTPRACYLDTGLSSGATNPIPLNSAARHTQGIIYISAAAYKLVLKNSSGTTIATYDNIDPGVPIGTGILAIANGGTGAATANGAVAALGAATAAEVADVAAEVASLSGALASSEKTHIATGTTGQRPSSNTNGDFRRNSTTSRWEGNNGAGWENFFTDTEVASQAEAQAGSINTHVMTPARTADAITALGGLVFLSTQSASNSATIDFTTGLDNTYDSYVLVVSNAKPATDDVEAWLRVGTGAGPTYQTSGYQYGITNIDSSGGGGTVNSNSAGQIVMTSTAVGGSVGNASGENFTGTIEFNNPEVTDFCEFTIRASYSGASSTNRNSAGGGRYGVAGAITGIRFLFESGNIASGRFTLYGRRKS